MGKITAMLRLKSLDSSECILEVRAFVDTASAYLTLPASWRPRLGSLKRIRTVQTQFADQRVGVADVYGPVSLKIEEFDEVIAEVMFIDMLPDEDGSFEPLLGYIPLEQANVALDMSRRKLMPLKYVDLKKLAA